MEDIVLLPQTRTQSDEVRGVCELAGELGRTTTKPALLSNNSRVNTAVYITAIVTIIAGIDDALMCYLGSDVLLSKFGITNNILRNSLNIVLVICGMGAYAAFVVRKSMLGVKNIAERIVTKGLSDPSKKKRDIPEWLVAAGTISLCSFGTFAYGAMCYFLTEHVLLLFDKNIDNSLLQTLSVIGGLFSSAMMLLSRTVATHDYLRYKPATLPCTEGSTPLGYGTIVISRNALAWIDILPYALTVFVSVTQLFKDLFKKDAHSNSALAISLLSALSSAFMHYVFSVQPVNALTEKIAKQNDAGLLQRAICCCFYTRPKKDIQKKVLVEHELGRALLDNNTSNETTTGDSITLTLRK